ncbi:pilus assembly FimT family protein [Geomonas agri]|uniref:pilus assembly FimT family protein n=1 Tax=Geomonas agri TaxID=2873702 RepID=UPI001CD2D892|nr:type II secretion system protein [Geomonas agri]
MRERGLTLLELVVVMAIIGTLLAIGSMQFSSMQRKSLIESQTRKIYNVLTNVRVEAMYSKTPRVVLLSGSQLQIYSSATYSSGVSPVSVEQLTFPMVMSSTGNRVWYDSKGMMVLADRSICVQPDNQPASLGSIDSVVVTTARNYLGKRQSGGACAPASIDQK